MKVSQPLTNVAAILATALGFLAAVASAQPGDEAAMFAKLLQTRDSTLALELAHQGKPAASFLQRGLEPDSKITALCAWALYHHPVPGTDQALRHLLWQSDQVAGYWAAKALGKWPQPANAEALAEMLPEERLGFWELSAGGVGRLTDVQGRQGRQAAEAQAWMPNLRVAYAAMEALGEMGGKTACETLARALDNDQYLIRYGAARGLGRIFQKRDAGNSPSASLDQGIAKLQKRIEADPVLLVRVAAQQALAMQTAAAAGDPNLLTTSPIWLPGKKGSASPNPPSALDLPAIAFVKTTHRSESNLGFRDSYFFPKTPKYHSGENLYTLTPPQPDGALKNLTQLTQGEVQGPEISYDGNRLLFAMRRNRDVDGFHIFEINIDGSDLRQITDGNCNDVDPGYLPDGRITFCSDRAGYQEYYHQERSRVIYVMNADGSGIEQITFNPNQDYEPLVLSDGRILYGSYRFYAQDGHEGPLRGERLGLSRIETILRTALPDGSADNLFYGSMRGSFYSPLRPMPFSDQRSGWHPRGFHVGVSVSQSREMPDGRILCVTPAGLTLVDPVRAPVDCEMPIYPEIVNLAGGEEVYIHNYDEMNPCGRYTTPYPVTDTWVLVSHAPWQNLNAHGYGLYYLNVATRELKLVYDDPQMAEVDPVPLAPHREPPVRPSQLASSRPETGLIYCNSVANSDLPFDRSAVKYVRVLEGIQMGQSIAANAAFRTRLLGTAPIHPDGSFYVEVPADIPVRFELLDENQQMLAHETAFNYVRPGETKGCVGCHEPRKHTSANSRPLAMNHPPVPTLRQRGDLIYMGKPERPYNAIYRD